MANEHSNAHEASTTQVAPKKSLRGFASMSREKQREIASKGGHAAHAKGTAHEFSADEARAAGRKGGEAVSRDRAPMAAIGRAGGHNSNRNRRTGSEPPEANASDADAGADMNKDEDDTMGARPSSIGMHAHAHQPN